ncbi:DHA2 family efflux MFS transporter permease subunit [Enterococcus gilvus]|uniref:DHA2 family efflux MFS transporter permease subunit n=1 Tax=Enterococcus gilvus TaxID=160453 RepID=UPI003D6A1A63
MEQHKLTAKVIGAVVSTGILSFCGVLVETAMNVTFPTLSTEFNVNTSTVQWMITIYLLVLAIVIPLSGFLKRSFKNKTLFLVALSFFTVGLIIDAVATSFSILLFGRVIQGVGTGIGLPLMFNIILEQVPSSKMGTMMGIGTMIPAIAPAIGPTFGGLVVTKLGWRFIFILILPIMIAAFILGITTIEQKREVQRSSFDFFSLLAIAVFFIGSILGFSNMGTHDFLSIQVLGAFLLSISGFISLTSRSKKISNPILDFSLLTNYAYFMHVLGFFIMQLVLMGLVFILPNYIQIVNGSSAQVSGFIVFPGAVLGSLFTPLGGRLLDRFGPKKPILFGCTVITFSLVAFTILCNSMSNLTIGVLYFLFTFGIGFSFGNLMTNGLRQLSNEDQANGNAIIMTFQQFAGAAGTSIVAAIITKNQSQFSDDVSQAVINGSKAGFVFLFALFAVEIVLITRLFIFNRKIEKDYKIGNEADG